MSDLGGKAWDPIPQRVSDEDLVRQWTPGNPAPMSVAYLWIWKRLASGRVPSRSEVIRWSGLSGHRAELLLSEALPDFEAWTGKEMKRAESRNPKLRGDDRQKTGNKSANRRQIVGKENIDAIDIVGDESAKDRQSVGRLVRARSSSTRTRTSTSTPQGGPAGPAAPDAPKPAGPDIGQPPLEPWLHGQGKGATRPPADWLAREGGGDRELGRARLRDACAKVTEAVVGHVDPSRIVAPGKALTSLLAFLEWPPLEAWLADALLVAEAMHHCPDKTFARNIRAEGWADGVNRSRSVGTLAVHERWGDRLEAAQRWKHAGSGRAGSVGEAPSRQAPPTKADPAAVLFGAVLVEFEAEMMRPGGIERLTAACKLAAEAGGSMEAQMARVRARLTPGVQLQCLQGGAS